eukprot:CAMPEP_0170179088 /NCGR_PEP_ID=MMETSP0040_2-20121228/15951_1 /TAXON_ID=641309 /ORGANISM="Lotharella oceanica, Strain CCMP622" /LENGTH=37 /DNA_ID= /DNA_START= /DNA_END= /DNA_ORIENTATION=
MAPAWSPETSSLKTEKAGGGGIPGRGGGGGCWYGLGR